MRQIYYYITFACNLRCRHCYVGDNLAPHSHAPFHQVTDTLYECYRQGARKVTFLGGEPTLHPRYDDILTVASEIGYRQLIVDTNGILQYPLPDNLCLPERLIVRFSIEGATAKTHERVRGKGTFVKTLRTLQRVVADGIRTEITFTINGLNINEIESMVKRFRDEGISEINFHFLSLMGNGRDNQQLGLSPEAILYAQEQLDRLKEMCGISLRYPRLLVREEDLRQEVDQGCGCRIFKTDTLLIFPGGETHACPLEITPSLQQQIKVEGRQPFSGCPLSWRLLPAGVPKGYVMTCISWKYK
ncbi:MAG: radical SAM protein [Chloroflexi bacterium]|nr:radical SAM protein [Chloroflexota bacterium]